MPEGRTLIPITIDNHPYEAEPGLTILQAAERNGIYIPTLCAHKGLTPFGGCRMCIVEVEGLRGFPTSCTTPVEPGMIIRTHTAQISDLRMEVLQLILSEHTSSCLICDERDDCKESSITIRKAGVTTGCRYCPNDGQCELQKVAEYLGVTEIGYPISYRGLPVENEDPFYDRDYNLCILCGRCIRVCQDVRAAATLAFCLRGQHAVVGPAFGRSHMDAGCEFCGACVAVCPTGALTEKAGKWDGAPERESVTTCPFCGVGCQMNLLVKHATVIGSRPAEDHLVNNGQLCVRGRFCVTEMVGGHDRLTRPYAVEQGRVVPIDWEDAIARAAGRLSACGPQECGMVIAADCCNEDLYVAQKFMRTVIGSHQIDTPARSFYGAGFDAYLDLMRVSAPLSTLKDASCILCVGLDVRFGRSVVGVELRQAFRRGATLLTMHPRDHSLATISQTWIRPTPGTEPEVLEALGSLAGGDAGGVLSAVPQTIGHLASDLGAAGRVLGERRPVVILVGSEYLQSHRAASILEAIGRLARSLQAVVLPLPAQSNLVGSVLMGAYAEVLPGGRPSPDPGARAVLARVWGAAIPGYAAWKAAGPSKDHVPKVMYLIGDVPPECAEGAEFVIFQSIYPRSSGRADLVLPAAAFTEIDGTMCNGEARVQRVRKAVEPPGEARPDWLILATIAEAMGSSHFGFENAAAVHREIVSLVPDMGDFETPERAPRRVGCDARLSAAGIPGSSAPSATPGFPFLLSVSAVEHTYRGIPLSSRVEGARAIFKEGAVLISPEDARGIGASEGDQVRLAGEGFELSGRALISSDQTPGWLHLVLAEPWGLPCNPCAVRMERSDV